MEKIINVNGKNIKFKSCGGTLRRYRMAFKSDMIKDLMKLQAKFENKKINSETQFEILDLELFEQIAWAMAKTSDDSIPPIENWLDEFETFSIYQILPQLSELLITNFQSIDNEKKNIIPTEVQNQN